ncbi:MAG: hypothetical protein GWN58_58300, partial [Anaerolineae bacterium]|nr:hypothetical protein [Anaerolineae bacterium]
MRMGRWRVALLLGILAGPLVLLATHGARVLERVSVATDGTQGDDDSFHPSLSADGRFVAFDSKAENLGSLPKSTKRDVFLRDTCIGAPAGCTPSTILISQCNGQALQFGSDSPSVSADGRFVAFDSDCSDLHPRDFFVNSVYLFDTCIGAPAGCTPSTIFVSEAAPFGFTDSG